MELSDEEIANIDRELERPGYTLIRTRELSSLAVEARSDYLSFLSQSKINPTRKSFDFRTFVLKPWLFQRQRCQLPEPRATVQGHAVRKRPTDADHQAELRRGLRNRSLLERLPDSSLSPGRRFHGQASRHPLPASDQGEQLDKPFYQVSVLLSRKGEDFVAGGGFVEDRHGNRIDLEEVAGFGTMVIFDGRTPHGVDDVDLDQVIDFTSTTGRLAAFVNLYAVLVSSML